MPRQADDQGPHFVDQHVGERIRRRRKALGLSQDDLGGAVNLTFQQIQKYERGANRVSASRLYQISKALQASIAYFFEGLPNPARAGGVGEDEGPAFVHDMPLAPEERQLISEFGRIDSRQVRKMLLGLVHALAAEAAAERAAADEPGTDRTSVDEADDAQA